MAEFNDRVFVFSGETFEKALTQWAADQIRAYPHQEELIRTAGLAMRDFLDSEQIRRHKMCLEELANG